MTHATLAQRIQWILTQNGLKKVEFAHSLGITPNYVYLLTSGKKTTVSETLAKLIESTYGYAADWVLTGAGEPNVAQLPDLQLEAISRIRRLDACQLQAVADFIRSLDSNKHTRE